MMKTTIRIALFVWLIPLSSWAQTINLPFLVHITAFAEDRPTSFFADLKNVSKKIDSRGIYHYYFGAYATQTEADSVKGVLNKKGYPYAYVIDLVKLKKACELECNKDPMLLGQDVTDPVTKARQLSHLFFDYDKSILRAEAQRQLESLVKLFMENLTFSVVFKGHADGHGTASYNQTLSQRRAEAAQHFLKTHGISPLRIKATAYGKELPVALNERQGRDCPEGRKYNRRVEIFIYDVEGNVLNAYVEPIAVPDDLMIK
jgi:outer membrane protein OmpA-like peptidoglycan-associated protein